MDWRKGAPTVATIFILIALVLVIAILPATAAQSKTAELSDPVPSGIFRGASTAVKFDVSPPLTTMIAQAQAPVITTDEIPEGNDIFSEPLGPQSIDPIVQPMVGPGMIPTPTISFDGPPNIANVSPPDPVGDVGPNHYVAMSNLYSAIYDKLGNELVAPFPNNTFWAGFGGDCETDNAGDPIVLYDQFADRWLVTQFTSSGPTYFNCVAISQTPDPTGTYYRYAFGTGTAFPDYPKYGIWHDAYYISTRDFDPGYVGIGAYAVNRNQMIAGNPAPQIISFLVPLGGTPYNIGDGLLPGDIDGSMLPPAGAPNYYAGTMDDGAQYGAPQDAINIWEFHADFDTPANSTFTLEHVVPVSPFDSQFPCSPSSRNCIPQPGTSNKVDILSYRQRPLHRLAYRNFGTHESLVTNQSVEADTNLAGIRWYEIRDPNNSPVLYQEGTFAPGVTDGIHRWMGSIAMDQSGNIALGYSASDATSTFPSVWYTGRLSTDPLGQMPQGEASIIDGTGSQTGSSRWGDYTSMNIDPVDDCTFWYVNEYLPTTSSVGWQLRIGAFKFDQCGAPDFNIIAEPETQSICAPNDALYDLDIVSYQGYSDTVSLNLIGNPAGTTASFSPNNQPAPFTSTLTIGNTGAGTPGNYSMDIVGIAPTSTHTTTVGLDLFDSTPGSVTLLSPPDLATDVAFNPFFDWTAATQGVSYTLEIADDAGFTNIVYSTTVTTDEHQLPIALSALTTYYWRVTPHNICGNGPTSAVFSFTTQESSLQCNGPTVDFNVSIPADWTVTTGGGNPNVFWTDLASCGEAGNWTGGTGDAACASSDLQGGGNYDTELRTPPIDLSGYGLPTLTYKANYQNNTLDFLDVDVSANGGISWTNVLSWNEDHGSLRALPGEDVTLDLWQFAGQEIIVRWRYYDPSGSTADDLYVQIDDVALSCPVGPAIRLDKTVGTDPNVCAETDDILVLGDNNVTYCYEVTNTGTVTLTQHDLDDNELGSILASFPFTLTPASSTNLTVTALLTQTTVNTATWTAYNVGPTDVATATDSARVKVVQPAQLPVYEGFESGDLPFYMYSEVTTSGSSIGRVQVTNSNPHSGTYALDIDTDCGGAACSPNTIQAALLSVDLAAHPQVFLDFWVDEHGDENNPEDGVFVSDDGGTTWALIHSLNDSPQAYTFVSIDLDAAVASAGMSLVDGFLIKFQSMDNFEIPTDGYSFDDIQIYPEEPIPGPAIQLQKTVGTDPNSCAVTNDIILLGSAEVTYCYKVLNTGTVTFTLHDLDDTEIGSILSAFPYTLTSPFDSIFVTETVMVTQTVINTATWTAYNAGPTDVTTSTASARVKVVQPTQLPVNEGFESGDLPDYMYSEVTTSGTSTGRVEVTTFNPHSGNYALHLDTDCGGGTCSADTIQAALLLVDLGSVSEVILDFWVDEHSDENDPEDGVFVSDDGGATWALIHSLNDSPQTYTNVIIDLDQAVANAGMSLVDGFLIKFQSMDEFEITTDGYSFDDIQIFEDIPTPDINVTPGSLSSSQFANEVMTDTFTIENLGNAALNWTLTEASSDCNSPSDVPWVSASPTSGTIPGSSSTAVNVVFDSTGLTPGSINTAKLCIDSDDPDEPTVEVDLTLTVLERPVINVSTNTLGGNMNQNEMMTQTLTISNTGDADLDWLITEGTTIRAGGCGPAGNLPWVAVSPDSGSTPPGSSDDVAVVFDTTGLAAGNYTGELCITSDAPDNPEVVVTLNLTVLQSYLYLPAIRHDGTTATNSIPENVLPIGGLILLPAAVFGWQRRREQGQK